jgi:hypothetical protein
MAGCPWWAWVVIAGLLLCLLPVAVHALGELWRWRRP